MRCTALIALPMMLAAAPPIAAETVPVAPFRSVELSGGGTIVIRRGPAQVRILEGSSQVTSFRVDADGQLKIDACSGRCPPAYRLAIEVRYPTVLPMALKGGGKISAAPGFGPQRVLAAGVDGGGQIDLRAVRATTIAAGINGGGQILVGESRTLAAAVSGGGEVGYAGNPRVTTVNDGEGVVHRGN